MARFPNAGLARATAFFLTICLPLVFMAGCDKLENRSKMKIGYMNCNNEEETTGRFTPMTLYLSEKTGVDFEFVPVDTNDFEKRFKSGEFAFTHSNSILYVILKEHHDLILLASEKRGKFGPRTAGTIIVRKDSGITKLSELKGKRIAF